MNGSVLVKISEVVTMMKKMRMV